MLRNAIAEDSSLKEKRCARCGYLKNIGQFYKSSRHYDGLGSWCKECKRAYRRTPQQQARDKERRKNRDRSERKKYPESERARTLRSYGISAADYDRMFKAQAGRCTICGSATPGGRGMFFNVDHDHITGKVRGLLCTNCNLAVGYMKDDSARLRRAADYLEGKTG